MKASALYPVGISILLAAALAVIGRPGAASLSVYKQVNLVSNKSGARHKDPKLVNPWGIAFSSSGPFWVNDERSGYSTVYDGSGKILPAPRPVIVPQPAGGSGRSTPTGIVFNGFISSGAFDVQGTGAAIFIFDTLQGTIAAWNGGNGANAVTILDNSATAAYTGLAIGNSPLLYAANFRAGTVEVFDANYKPVNNAGAFMDPKLPEGFAPFGIANIDGDIFVTYAMQDATKTIPVNVPGNGVVDKFDSKGNLLGQEFASRGTLNSPWGLALAPRNFGSFSNDLLVGNFGDGTINAFNPMNRTFQGQLMNQKGNPIAIPGLWALIFGNGGSGGDPNKLYFAAGINDEAGGLFGSIAPARRKTTRGPTPTPTPGGIYY